MSFVITDSAGSALHQFTVDELAPGEFIRIQRQYQCGGSRFEIVVDDASNTMDEELMVSGVRVIINKSCMELLEECTLDFTEAGFIFLDEARNQC